MDNIFLVEPFKTIEEMLQDIGSLFLWKAALLF